MNEHPAGRQNTPPFVWWCTKRNLDFEQNTCISNEGWLWLHQSTGNFLGWHSVVCKYLASTTGIASMTLSLLIKLVWAIIDLIWHFITFVETRFISSEDTDLFSVPRMIYCHRTMLLSSLPAVYRQIIEFSPSFSHFRCTITMLNAHTVSNLSLKQ